jgi:hypothetical protein
MCQVKLDRDQTNPMMCRNEQPLHFDSRTCIECETRTVFPAELMARETPDVVNGKKQERANYWIIFLKCAVRNENSSLYFTLVSLFFSTINL